MMSQQSVRHSRIQYTSDLGRAKEPRRECSQSICSAERSTKDIHTAFVPQSRRLPNSGLHIASEELLDSLHCSRLCIPQTDLQSSIQVFTAGRRYVLLDPEVPKFLKRSCQSTSTPVLIRENYMPALSTTISNFGPTLLCL